MLLDLSDAEEKSSDVLYLFEKAAAKGSRTDSGSALFTARHSRNPTLS